MKLNRSLLVRQAEAQLRAFSKANGNFLRRVASSVSPASPKAQQLRPKSPGFYRE